MTRYCWDMLRYLSHSSAGSSGCGTQKSSGRQGSASAKAPCPMFTHRLSRWELGESNLPAFSTIKYVYDDGKEESLTTESDFARCGVASSDYCRSRYKGLDPHVPQPTVFT